jgi:hypothetical protein
MITGKIKEVRGLIEYIAPSLGVELNPVLPRSGEAVSIEDLKKIWEKLAAELESKIK